MNFLKYEFQPKSKIYGYIFQKIATFFKIQVLNANVPGRLITIAHNFQSKFETYFF